MLVMQANGMVSHSTPPGKTDPVRSGTPLCIPVVGKVQLSSRLQQLLQKSNELDRLQALQQQQQAARQAVLGGSGDHRTHAATPDPVPPDGRGAVCGAQRAEKYQAGRHTNGQLKEAHANSRQPASGAASHVVGALGDGFAFKLTQDAARTPSQQPTAPFSLNSGSHQKILPKPVPPPSTVSELPVNFKVEKVKSKHKVAKASSKTKVDPSSQRTRPRVAAKVKAVEPRASSVKCAPSEQKGARPRTKPAAVLSGARPNCMPPALRAYQEAAAAERAARRPVVPPAPGCSDLEQTDSEPEGVPLAAHRYRESRRYRRCCRLLLTELRRSAGTGAARLYRHLLRPPTGAADSERRRRLLARQRLEARRLLAALEEARQRRRQLAERARQTRLLAEAAAAQPSRTAQLLLRDEPDARSQPRHNRSRLAQLVRRPCCHQKGTKGACPLMAVPCTRHCAQHILYNVDQLLFQHCTAKFSDNTQCCAPVFDIKHELPLCEEHARKRDNYEKMAEKTKSEPKKKSRSIKRPKRRKKAKKKTPPRESTPTDLNRQGSFEDGSFGEMEADMVDDDDEDEDEEDEDDLEDDDDEEEGGATTPAAAGGEARAEPELDRSLELHLGNVLENEFSEVLSKLPDEAFTELFSDAHAGDLVHKETEELERALEAVERESDVQGPSGSTVKVEFQPPSTGGSGEPPAATAPRHHVLNGNPNLGSREMEESVYSQLAQGISLENAISNVLNGQEMNTLNQLLNHLDDTVIQDADNPTISAS